MLEGKAFSLKLAAKSMDDAHKIIRDLDPKSRFLYSKLDDPEPIDEEAKTNNENKNNSNIIDEKKEALV